MDALDTEKRISSVSLSLLLQEIVPMLIRVTQRLADPDAATEETQTRIDTALSKVRGDLPGTCAVFDNELLASDDVALRVDSYGYDLGIRLTEVLMYKAASSNRIFDVLEVMKFICRDVWRSLHGKQMDNLRTNHRGTFVLVDSRYKFIAEFNSSKGKQDSLMKARPYSCFPCGVIRGVLHSFGIDAFVLADVSLFPAITFNIQTSINN